MKEAGLDIRSLIEGVAAELALGLLLAGCCCCCCCVLVVAAVVVMVVLVGNVDGTFVVDTVDVVDAGCC